MDTNLGPVVSIASAERIRKQVADAGKPYFVFCAICDLGMLTLDQSNLVHKHLSLTIIFLLQNREYISFMYASTSAVLINTIGFSGTTYVAPQVLVNVNHCRCYNWPMINWAYIDLNWELAMDVMMEETFGPVVGIQRVGAVISWL